jgi:hypothetical protein
MKRILILSGILLILLLSCDLLLEEPDSSDGGRSIDVDNLEATYLGFYDYYNGNCIAVKYDFTNKTDKTIDKMRWSVDLTYDSGSSQTFYPDINQTIDPHETIYSMWVPLACGMVWYSSHQITEIHVWYTDGSEYVWND